MHKLLPVSVDCCWCPPVFPRAGWLWWFFGLCRMAQAASRSWRWKPSSRAEALTGGLAGGPPPSRSLQPCVGLGLGFPRHVREGAWPLSALQVELAPVGCSGWLGRARKWRNAGWVRRVAGHRLLRLGWGRLGGGGSKTCSARSARALGDVLPAAKSPGGRNPRRGGDFQQAAYGNRPPSGQLLAGTLAQGVGVTPLLLLGGLLAKGPDPSRPSLCLGQALHCMAASRLTPSPCPAPLPPLTPPLPFAEPPPVAHPAAVLRPGTFPAGVLAMPRVGVCSPSLRQGSVPAPDAGDRRGWLLLCAPYLEMPGGASVPGKRSPGRDPT